MNVTNERSMKIITHSGNFHTDEVFACAVLSLLNDGNIEVIRSRDSEVWATGDYVVDVGGEYDSARGRFDHHQEGGAGVRPNGIPYSSFGLVWKEFGENLCGNREAARRIDEKMVQPIDAADCGIDSFILTGKNIFPYLFHHLVASFRPTWKEELNHSTTYDEGFARAFDIATEVLKREIITAQDYEEGARVAEDAYQKAEDKRVVIVDGQYPWEEVLNKHPEPIFVVKPDKTEPRWKVRTVRLHHESFKARKDFPKAWAGKNGEEFARVTGVPDAIFCHNSGTYIVVAGSKEGALALAKLAVDA
ncbi:MAG: Metal-dependent protein hydrolase [Parcubacteria group bacterium GW2011_GWA1_44_13]|uniref:Metal-dependent protein hydrolase n=1 Tax=Candidatus Nomurabacteria bacterium GW2011_GWB1_44_12 TaxID=1618748 RepID=A0A837IAS7_9BACT|nr:MAG: Metal-dependent protein hydrolase [Candidatus Nomurabacteria bacterium GW2011_GWD1_44_10]KKT37100.1 MAG: Metal-dependent protein hydrolase [Candidatus Nomurabacteria bacterium GW2011_GWB1_44_12]KKT38394.1 MAG: Metal-dependent protein hydrolase [Parcubacteria group bacterium GW2011_GWA1_44_13]HBB43818.1 metal-dependent hydrolase [Candidatus Yonathbacteria bacterium]